jgi:hypothetical protein
VTNREKWLAALVLAAIYASGVGTHAVLADCAPIKIDCKCDELADAVVPDINITVEPCEPTPPVVIPCDPCPADPPCEEREVELTRFQVGTGYAHPPWSEGYGAFVDLDFSPRRWQQTRAGSWGFRAGGTWFSEEAPHGTVWGKGKLMPADIDNYIIRVGATWKPTSPKQ